MSDDTSDDSLRVEHDAQLPGGNTVLAEIDADRIASVYIKL